MKKVILSILLGSILGLSSLAQAPEQRLATADHHYDNKEYKAATETYQALADEGYVSSDLYYNLGNAYYRQDELAKAILYYERAAELSPRDRDIKENLALAYSKTPDQIAQIPTLFIVRIWDSFAHWFTTDGWCIICLFLFFITIVGIVIVRLGSSYNLRKSAFVVSLICTALFLISLGATIYSTQERHEAIIMQTMVTVKSSPEANSVDKVVLHAGTKIKIEDQIQDWYKIRLSDGNSGWLNSSSLEII